ncbi:flagellar associated protein, callose synthase-like protein [Dorcoceras hygrometricum]|uniref:Flagellar associated protein, callose synthase-like protein n=1 Tax=Dorcoceras hygrometricum TaxID=472368 RepID=A0A2Z7ARS9_9LAMI|nr:flagellar associated protein, callose synthase-like protein [Dorcoceras hygrometricum]
MVKLHPKKVSTNKSVHTYIKKNLDVRPACVSSKQTEDTASGTEGGQSKMTKPVETQVYTLVEKKNKKTVSTKKKAEMTAVEKKKKKNVAQSARRWSSPLTQRLQYCSAGAHYQESSDEKNKEGPLIGNDQAESQPNPLLVIPAGEGHEGTAPRQEEQVDGADSNADKQEAYMGYETQTDQEGHDENVSTVAQGEQEKSSEDGPEGHEGETTEMEECVDNVERIEQDKRHNQIDMETATHDRDVVVWYGPEQPAHQSMTFAGKAKGKGVLEVVSRPNPIEEHCRLVINTVWEDVSTKMADYDKWMHFRTVQEEAREPAMLEEQVDKIVRKAVITEGTEVVTAPEHQDQSNEHQAHEEPELQPEQVGEIQGSSGGQQEQPVPEEEDQPHNSPAHSSSQYSGFRLSFHSVESDSMCFFPDPDPISSESLTVSEKFPVHDEDMMISMDSRMLSMDSKVHSMDSRIGSLDSKVEQLLYVQTFLKYDFNTYKCALCEKMDTLAADVASSQTSLETSLVRQFTEHQLQIANDLDFFKLQLAELVNHLKELGFQKGGMWSK